ncbi:MAG: TIGR02147 family protein, partial [Chitinispirillaceae bacterium]|nr:TIGR02147 family protein [Chitinispirillaceae bacterium]
FDYRAFLRDYYTFKKTQNRYFSYRFFAHKAGIKSPVFFKEVAEGQKNLSRSMIEKFSAALQLSEKEATYFKYLVLFDQAKTGKEKQEHYVVLRSMENAKSEKALNADQYDYFSTWYNVVIRELVTLFDFKDNFELLATTVLPPIRTREAKASVELLLKLGLIKKKPDGGYEQTDTAITAESGVASLAIRQFNKAMATHAVAAIEDFPKTERSVSGITIGISPAMYDIINAEMAAFKDRIVTLVSRDEKCDRVYQFNMQLFPMSRKRDVSPGNGRAGL